MSSKVKKIIYIVILSNIAVLTFLYAAITKNSIEVEIKKYPYIDQSRHFIKQENYFSTIEPLRKKVKSIAADFEKTGRDVSLYIEYLNTGSNISINPQKYIFPASLIKVPVAIAVMKRIEDGKWDLSNKLVLLDGDKDNLSGNLDSLLGGESVGTTFTIEYLLESLLMYSDNTANAILLRNIGEKDLKDVISALGLDELIKEDGSISSKEYSRIIKSLYSASYLNRESSNYLLYLLDNTNFDEFISGDIDKSIPFPHKYGEHIGLRIYADSGIMFVENRPVLITIVVKGRKDIPFESDYDASQKFLKEISKEVYTFVETYKNPQ